MSTTTEEKQEYRSSFDGTGMGRAGGGVGESQESYLGNA